jgi:hypothetical protein
MRVDWRHRLHARAALVACAAMSLAVLPVDRLSSQAPAPALSLLIVLPDSATPLRQGAMLGIEEATHAAGLLGRRLSVTWTSPDDPAAPAGAHVIVGGLPAGALAPWLAALPDGAVYLDILTGDDGLRTTSCHPRLYHVAPSDAMRRDAVRVHGAGIDTGTTANVPAALAQALTWHHTLERYGAGQLNDRFAARFGMPMPPEAWTGWMAVKVAWEAAARAGAGESLAAVLQRPGLRFDGHKGWALDFRPWDRQLRQPLYVVTGTPPDTELHEVPGRSAGTTRDRLDVLGAGAEAMQCGT